MTAPSQPAPSPQAWAAHPPRRRAAVFPRADLLGAVGVLSLVSLLGLPLAWAWSRLAPGQLSLVQQDGVLAALPTQSQHRFDDLAIFMLLGLAAGVFGGVATWLLRQRRGPLALLGLALGSVLCAWLALRLGVWLADRHYSDAVRAAAPDSVVMVAPRIETAWVVIVQALAAVLTYGVLTASNGHDDLSRRLS